MRSGTRKLGLGALAIVAVVAIAAGLYARRFVSVRETVVGERLHVLLGGGGNSVILATGHGAFLVDTKLSLPAREELHRALQIGGGRVVGIVDTHYHFDHAHGNPLYPPGTTVFAAARTPALMDRLDAAFWREPSARRLMPNTLVTSPEELDFDGERLRIVPLPPAHTGGDVAVLFENEATLVTGDVVLDGFYPIFDLASGGSVPGTVRACDALLALKFDRVVPGHGPMGTRADVVRMREFDYALWDHARRAAAANETLADALRTAPQALRRRENLPFYSSLSKDLDWAMQEARACLSRHDCDVPAPTP